jgi:hypothetical protein
MENQMKNDERTAVICWESKSTGARGFGYPISLKSAKELAEALDRKYPELTHWTVPSW